MELKNKLREMESRLYRLENPFMIELGEEVVCKNDSGTLMVGAVIARYWTGETKRYLLESSSDLPRLSSPYELDIEEGQIMKLSDIKEGICGNERISKTNR